jgi:serine/threonine protein kinase
MTDSKDHAQSLFLNALEIPTAGERAAYVEAQCGADPELRKEVEELLDHARRLGPFLESDEEGVDDTIGHPISERPGTVIGPYKLLQQIGEGGMGVVFMAEQTEPIQRTVALKIIKPGMDTRQVIARFEAERQALAMMDHPNIAKVLDAGTTDSGRPYFVMELVKGVPITQFCDDKQLSVRERLELLLPVCQAVQHAHQKGVIHRDIKPTNVLVAEYDNHAVPKVIDFGVAKATAQKLTERTMFTEFGQVIGTVEYMSPEQAKLNQLDIDTRSDIYSLGVLLYEILTGSTPFERERLREAAFDEVLRIIREEEPPLPSTRLTTCDTLPSIAANRHTEPAKLSRDVRGELDWIVMKCLQKDRNSRYLSATDVAVDLGRWLRDEPLSIRPPDPAYLLRMWLKRNVGSVGAALALGTVWGVLGGLVCWLIFLHPFELPMALRRAIYLATLSLWAAGGFIAVSLVRPKNAIADLVVGAISGGIAAVVCYTISWGWLAVSLAGVPYGIWLGMLSALIFIASVCIAETMSAGMLLRRHGQLRSTAMPYAELVAPSILALAYTCGLLVNLAIGRHEGWLYYLVPIVLLWSAVISVGSRLHWLLRVLLHATWLVSVYIFVTRPLP